MQATPRSDVYSFGVFMWSLYTGHKPYVCSAAGALSPNTLFPLFPEPAQPQHYPYTTLALRCLQLDPRDRPGFAEITDTLACFFNGGQPSGSATSLPFLQITLGDGNEGGQTEEDTLSPSVSHISHLDSQNQLASCILPSFSGSGIGPMPPSFVGRPIDAGQAEAGAGVPWEWQ